MQKEPDPGRTPARIRNRPTWLISRTYARSHRILSDAFAMSGTGLSSYHYRLLAAVDEFGPASQADLSRWTGVDRSDVVSVLRELEQSDLVTRSIDPTNRRRNLVTVTASGKKSLRALDSIVDDVQERVMEPLSASQRTQLLKLLGKLNGSV